MQFELTKNQEHPLKIYIYKDLQNSLVANLSYSVDESLKELTGLDKTFQFLGTLDAAEIVGKLKLDSPSEPKEKAPEMTKSNFVFGLLYTADNFITDVKDRKAMKKIINKITLV